MKVRLVLPVESVCKGCERVERYSLFGYLGRLVNTVLGLLGLCVVVLMVLYSPLAVFSAFSELSFDKFAVDNSVGLRGVALNYTSYDGDDPLLFSLDLLEHLPRVRYVRGASDLGVRLQLPLDTLRFGGDCKNSAVLFTGLLRSVGVRSRVDCSIGDLHCVSLVDLNRRSFSEHYAVVDLTGDTLVVYNDSVNHWDCVGCYEEYYSFVK